jgi:hypothetical protein
VWLFNDSLSSVHVGHCPDGGDLSVRLNGKKYRDISQRISVAFPLQRPGFDPVMRDFLQTKWHWGKFSPSTSVSLASCHSHAPYASVTRGWYSKPTSGRCAELI